LEGSSTSRRPKLQSRALFRKPCVHGSIAMNFRLRADVTSCLK
uniref:Uncharacterized protein n=1 Tax=Haemonchus placei TaxID=6290 RepID=A0A0N4XAI1_HAEPC